MIRELAEELRDCDREELEAANFSPVEEIIRQSVNLSTCSCAATTPDGKLVALFGVAPPTLVGDKGAMWMLATDRLYKYPVGATKLARRFVEYSLRLYPQLENWVFEGNTHSVAWLKVLGFTVEKAAPHGPKGEMFHRFHMRLYNDV
jgi:hypothetical protein